MLASLALVDEWDAGPVAVGVLDATGVLARHGPTSEVRPLASVTKLFSALAIHVAAEEGALSLEDAAGPPGATLAHLLAHASGLSPADPAHVLARPGQRRIYSNAGYDLAGAHAERATGIAFGDYMREGVLAPLGATGVRLVGSPARDGWGSVEDLLLLAAELLTPALVHPETAAAMRRVAFPGIAGVVPDFGRQDPCDWGLGPEIAGHKHPHWTGGRRSSASFGHFGQSGSFVLVDPEARLACVVLCTRPFGPWARTAWPAFVDALFSELGVAPADGEPPN